MIGDAFAGLLVMQKLGVMHKHSADRLHFA